MEDNLKRLQQDYKLPIMKQSIKKKKKSTAIRYKMYVTLSRRLKTQRPLVKGARCRIHVKACPKPKQATGHLTSLYFRLIKVDEKKLLAKDFMTDEELFHLGLIN